MNLPAIVANLYTNKNSSWMKEVEPNECEPMVLQLWLVQNDAIRVQIRFLDQYVFTLPPKMFLSLAWSIIPKYQKVPFVKWIKKVKQEEEYDFLISKIRKLLEMGDNDYNANKDRILKMIEDNKEEMFASFGISKKYWKKYGLSFENIKNYGEKRVVPQKGLEAWGL